MKITCERCPVEWRCFLLLGVVLDLRLETASQSSPDDDVEDVFRGAVAAAGDLQCKIISYFSQLSNTLKYILG